MRKDQTPLWLPERHSQAILKICPSSLDASQTHVLSPMRSPIGVQQVARNTVTHLQWATKVLKHSVVKLGFWAFRSVRLGLPSTLIRHENAALFLRLGLPSTPIRHENEALFLRLGLPSTLIRHENAALFVLLGLPSTPIRHENEALFLRLGLPSTLIRHENVALFLRLGLPSTLIRHENEALFLRLGLPSHTNPP